MELDITIDGARSLELLGTVVGGRNDFVCEDSEYVKDGAPCCLVAHCLFEAGVPVEELESMDTWRASDIGSTAIDDVTLPDGVELSSEARLIWLTAQELQDQQWSWGEVYVEAARKAADLGVV